MQGFFLTFLANQFIEFEILKFFGYKWKIQNKLTFAKKLILYGICIMLIFLISIIYCKTKPESKLD